MAKKVIVKIPNVTEEVRIGYSFNYMIKVMAETEAADDVQWDFSDVTFLHPFFHLQMERHCYTHAYPSCITQRI